MLSILLLSAFTVQIFFFKKKNNSLYIYKSGWDVIDAIQIHAYARSAKEVKDKINTYYTTFKDDFEGTNG